MSIDTVSSNKELVMKLIIFGATGTIGRHLAEQALIQGHQVTAFARKPLALKLDHRDLTRQSGDVLDQDWRVRSR